MDIRTALIEGRKLMNDHEELRGWILGLDRAKQRAGACHYRAKTITLSEHYIRMNEWDEVRNTVLHEIAHALTPADRGHGWSWASKCIELGIAPNRCYDAEKVNMPQGGVAIICPNHGEIGRRHRMPAAKMNGRYFCKRCKAKVTHRRVSW